jgi:hypothetical protein
MMPTARVLATTTLLCLMPLQGAVAAAYKWIDDKGETHYSQTPPNATKVEVIKTPYGTRPTPATTAPQTGNTAPSEPSADTTSSPETAKAEDAAIRAKNCTMARSNLEALKNAGEVTVKDANGLLHYLTPDERKSRSEEAAKSIKEFCKE